MVKRKSYDIRLKILTVIKENGPTSYADLERKVNTGYRSIKNNSEELELMGDVEIEHIENHPSNGRSASKVHLTKQGLQLIERTKKHTSASINKSEKK